MSIESDNVKKSLSEITNLCRVDRNQVKRIVRAMLINSPTQGFAVNSYNGLDEVYLKRFAQLKSVITSISVSITLMM